MFRSPVVVDSLGLLFCIVFWLDSFHFFCDLLPVLSYAYFGHSFHSLLSFSLSFFPLRLPLVSFSDSFFPFLVSLLRLLSTITNSLHEEMIFFSCRSFFSIFRLQYSQCPSLSVNNSESDSYEYINFMRKQSARSTLTDSFRTIGGIIRGSCIVFQKEKNLFFFYFTSLISLIFLYSLVQWMHYDWTCVDVV